MSFFAKRESAFVCVCVWGAMLPSRLPYQSEVNANQYSLPRSVSFRFPHLTPLANETVLFIDADRHKDSATRLRAGALSSGVRCVRFLVLCVVDLCKFYVQQNASRCWLRGTAQVLECERIGKLGKVFFIVFTVANLRRALLFMGMRRKKLT